MSSLRTQVERSKAEGSDLRNPFYTTNDGVIVLRVETSGGEVWMLPWHHFIFGRYEGGGNERLVLTFVALEVALRGSNLDGLIPEIVHQRVEWLRAAPRKYLKAANAEPAIDEIQVRSLAEPVVAE